MSTTASSARPRTGEGRGGGGAPPWRLRGLRAQSVPHCRIPSPDQVNQKYELGTQLGRGNFGTVWTATERKTGEVWAAKVVPKSGNKLKMLLLSREIQVLKLVEHPNIVYLREIFETPENVYLILELCERGELGTFCRDRGRLAESDAKDILAGVADAIHYLHRHGIVHRDLKLENVLLAAPPSVEANAGGATRQQPRAKLSDFGLAEVKDKRDHDHMMDLFCGTPYCMAPEILSERAYSQQCDVWSMGVILYTLVTGNSPYMGGTERDVLYSIYRHPNLQNDPSLETVTATLRDLLARMLHLDPAYRITAAEVVGHPWIVGEETQASASQDILTLMKEWRIEMTSSADVSLDRNVVSDPGPRVTQQTEAGVPAGLVSPRGVATPSPASPQGALPSVPLRSPRQGAGARTAGRRAGPPLLARQAPPGWNTSGHVTSPSAPEIHRATRDSGGSSEGGVGNSSSGHGKVLGVTADPPPVGRKRSSAAKVAAAQRRGAGSARGGAGPATGTARGRAADTRPHVPIGVSGSHNVHLKTAAKRAVHKPAASALGAVSTPAMGGVSAGTAASRRRAAAIGTPSIPSAAGATSRAAGRVRGGDKS